MPRKGKGADRGCHTAAEDTVLSVAPGNQEAPADVRFEGSRKRAPPLTRIFHSAMATLNVCEYGALPSSLISPHWLDSSLLISPAHTTAAAAVNASPGSTCTRVG